jgi:hypothetical protein
VLVTRCDARGQPAIFPRERSDIQGMPVRNRNFRPGCNGGGTRTGGTSSTIVRGIDGGGIVDTLREVDGQSRGVVGAQLDREVMTGPVIQFTIYLVSVATNCQQRSRERDKHEQRQKGADGTNKYGFCFHQGFFLGFGVRGLFQGDGSLRS